MKIFLSFLLSLSLCLPFSAVAQSDPVSLPSGYYLNLNNVKRIICIDPDGKQFAGTGFYISGHILATAGHVVAGMTACSINGKVIKTVLLNNDLDFALVESQEFSSEHFSFTCDAVQRDKLYLATGYAFGQDLVVQPIRGSTVLSDEKNFKGEVHFVGKVFGGMSGGPILDSEGRVVGIVNGGDSLGRANAVSRNILETPLCRS